MKQKTLVAILPLLLALTLFAGCSKEPPAPHSVVINIQAVAESIGMKEQIDARREEMNKELTAELKALSEEFTLKMENEKTRLGDSPSEEDTRKLQALRNQLSRQGSQARIKGLAKITRETSEIRQASLDEIKAVAGDVAREHGARVVLKGMAVFWSDDLVDITDEVIGRMEVTVVEEPVVEEQTE